MGEVRGFAVGRLPEGLGAGISEFTYEWAGVDFWSRVWEHEHDGGFRVDLKITVLRGEVLSDREALRDFLAYHHDWAPDSWTLEEFTEGAASGYAGRRVVFLMREPGAAVEVHCPSGRYDAGELRRIAAEVTTG